MARFSMRQPVVLPHEKDDLQRLFHSDSAASSTNSSVSWSLDITEKSDDRGNKITKMKPKFSNPSQESQSRSQDTATDSWEQSEKNDISYTMGNSNNKHTTSMKSSQGISSPNDVRDDAGSICNFMPAPGTILCFDCNSSTMSELTKPVMKDDRKKAQCPPPCCRPTGDPADPFEETINNLSSVSERSLDSVMSSDICGDNPPKDLLGKAVNAFRSGVHGILSCSDKICNPQKANNDSEKKLDETATTASLTPSASCESLHRMGAYKSENMSQSKPNNNDNKGNVSQEMDQLLKVLWDKEAVVTLSGAAGHEADMTISPLTLATYADAERSMEYYKNASLIIGNLPPVKEAGCTNKLSDMMGHMNFFKDDSTIIDEGNDVNDSVVGTALISTPSTVDLSHPLVEVARSESDEEEKQSSVLTAAVTPSPAKKNPVDDSQDTSGLLSYSVSGQWSGIVSPEKQILDKDEVDIMFGSDDVQYVAADNEITMTKPPLSPRTPTSKILIKPPPPSRSTTAKKGTSMKKMLTRITTPIAPKKSFKKQTIEMTVEDGEDDTNTKNTNEEQAPFVADFTSKDARVSMGLPASSSVDQNGFPIAKEDEELSSPSSDPSVRICTWCRRGGKDDIKFAKKLKLCSACQTTYYCSPICQSEDWLNGHATICTSIQP